MEGRECLARDLGATPEGGGVRAEWGRGPVPGEVGECGIEGPRVSGSELGAVPGFCRPDSAGGSALIPALGQVSSGPRCILVSDQQVLDSLGRGPAPGAHRSLCWDRARPPRPEGAGPAAVWSASSRREGAGSSSQATCPRAFRPRGWTEMSCY